LCSHKLLYNIAGVFSSAKRAFDREREEEGAYGRIEPLDRIVLSLYPAGHSQQILIPITVIG